MPIVLSLGGVVFVVVAFLVPGFLVAELATERVDGTADGAPPSWLDTLLIALTWGMGMVPTFTLFLHLATGWLVSHLTLACVSLANTIIALGFLSLRRNRDGGELGLAPRGHWRALWRDTADGARAHRAELVAALVVGGIYLLRYDNAGSPRFSCLHATGLIASGLSADPRDLLHHMITDAGIGITGVVAASLALFGPLGLRLLFALCGVLLALGGFRIGETIGRHKGWGVFGLLFLSLTPYVLFSQRLDENRISLAFGMGLIPFVVRPPRRWVIAGAFLGLHVAMRHVMAPAALAVALMAWFSRRRWLALAELGTAFILVTIPENLHHYYALHSIFMIEHNTQFPPFPYHIFGRTFYWQGEVNWPLYDHLVRTPHNPFPMYLMWPLQLAGYLGWLLFAVCIVGFVAIWGCSRRQALFWAMWSLPVMTGLSMQENWDYANKMGVMVIVFGSFTAWAVAGMHHVVRRPATGFACVTLLIAIGIGTVRLLADWRVPADERYYLVKASINRESPERVERYARAMTDIGLFPGYRRLASFGPLFSLKKLRAIWPDVIAPHGEIQLTPWGWYPNEPPPRGDAVTVEMNLTELPDDRPLPVRRTDAPADIDLSSGAVRLQSVRVPWDQRPLTVYADKGAAVSAVVIFFDEARSPASPLGSLDFIMDDDRCTIVGVSVGEYRACGQESKARDHGFQQLAQHVRDVKSASPIIRFRLPTGALSVFLITNAAAFRGFQWKSIVESSTVRSGMPLQLIQN
jgi:hypothetical protein